MEQATRIALRWWLIIAATLVIAGLLLNSCVRYTPLVKGQWDTVATHRITPLRIDYPTYLPSEGVTECSGDTIVVHIRNDVSYTPSGLVLAAHELTHVRDMGLYHGSCQEYILRYKSDTSFRLQVEAHAYCVAARVSVEVLGSKWEDEIQGAIEFLVSPSYALGMQREDIEQVVRRTCQPP